MHTSLQFARKPACTTMLPLCPDLVWPIHLHHADHRGRGMLHPRVHNAWTAFVPRFHAQVDIFRARIDLEKKRKGLQL